MSNRLSKENSLYLKQHADNPVDWWPWCDEAFEVAKKESKLLLVSIGYASCHWCHVMAHECFENEYIADLMNRYFVCIKVDREERPDIDNIYMEAVQMITHRGGWPLNVFCLPNGKPFFGGTYFPPEDKGHNIIPWPQLLMRIVDHYRKSPEELAENAENIVKNLNISNQSHGEGLDIFENADLLTAAQSICQVHDNDWGGFGSEPKFPPSMILDFLLEINNTQASTQNPQLIKRIDDTVLKTLQAMAHGGIYDQLGGGFARYSVDRYWVIPHFEKMLYDNALLIDIYTKGWLRYRSPLFKAVVEETVDWLKRDMKTDNLPFAASWDADSESEEGKYYVWTPQEVKDILGEEDARIFCDAYNITEKGNFENNTSNPTWVYDDDKKRKALKPLRKKLLKARLKRPPPAKDTKQLISWNSLLIRSLAEAGFYFNKPKWLEKAQAMADFFWDIFRTEQNRLLSVFYENKAYLNAYLDDYAFYVEACLAIASKIDWLKPETASIYIKRAHIITNIILTHFSDKEGLGYYFTSDDHEVLVSRKKIWLDNAIPSGNASMVHNLSTLYAIVGDPQFNDELQKMRKAYAQFAKHSPNTIAYALAGFTADAVGIIIIKAKPSDETKDLQKALAKKPFCKTFLLISDNHDIDHTYQLCVGTQCLKATNTLSEIIELI